MFHETPSPRLPQPSLFVLEESTGSVELFPAVWVAVEDLTMADAEIRHRALDRLLELNAPRFSPIVAYLLTTRLTDPDLKLRARMVNTLGEILAPDSDGHPAPDDVRNSLILNLSQVRTRQVFAILQVLADDSSLESHAARLIDACPYAGNHLVDILSDHKAPVEVRRQAAVMIGRVGFLDALSSLERLASKLETRLNGQKSMPFAPPPSLNEAELLPAVQAALCVLRTP
jgi:HEAT repeat protein